MHYELCPSVCWEQDSARNKKPKGTKFATFSLYWSNLVMKMTKIDLLIKNHFTGCSLVKNFCSGMLIKTLVILVIDYVIYKNIKFLIWNSLFLIKKKWEFPPFFGCKYYTKIAPKREKSLHLISPHRIGM